VLGIIEEIIGLRCDDVGGINVGDCMIEESHVDGKRLLNWLSSWMLVKVGVR
jgi:hypothetical protein